MRLLVNVIYRIWDSSRLCRIEEKLIIPRLLSISSSLMATLSNATQPKTDVFQGSVDRFNGLTVRSESEAETCDLSLFSKKLDDSLKEWGEEGRRGIWFRVSLEQSDWVPILAKKGFKFHHAKDDFVMMYLWLSKEENSNIPPYAHTMIGVGAVVVNDRHEILVVSEKYWKVPHWKLPGGYVEPGENLVDAAIREVFEETGVKTEFQTLLTMRHTHHGMFECSDIYTVVNLKPLTDLIEKDDREISKCQWMKIDEYLTHPNVHDLNRFFVEKYLEYAKNNVKIDWHHGIHQIIKKPYTIYYVTKSKEEQ